MDLLLVFFLSVFSKTLFLTTFAGEMHRYGSSETTVEN